MVCMSRKRRKIVAPKSDVEDNIDVSSEEVDELHFVCRKTTSENVVLRERFGELGQEMRLKRESLDIGNMTKPTVVEIVCDVCHKSFFIVSESDSYVCPYCGAKHMYSEEELIDCINQHQNHELVEKLVEKGTQRILTRMNGLFNVGSQDKWTNESKGQISLEQGSEEYKEYVEDIKEQDPMKPDDVDHVELEKHNADLVTKEYDITDNPEALKESTELVGGKLKVQNEMMKRAVHGNAVGSARRAAVGTAGRADDIRASEIGVDNEFLHNTSVQAGEYDDALVEFVVEGPK